MLTVYNSRTRALGPFTPRGQPVTMYVCGPTVYDHAHLGHARSYVFFDVVRRVLESQGNRVVHIQNFTDASEEIARKAAEESVSPRALADRYVSSFLADMDALHVMRAHHYPRVTEHLPAMIAQIQRLLDSGLAYRADGDVFLDTARAGRLGRVSGWRLEEIATGDEPHPAGPRHDPEDFVLWRCDGSRGQVWPSPWGLGRPGWHVECSAMALAYAPDGLDLHGGGVDLKFPHHDSEAAAAEAVLGKTYARYWLHNGFVTVWKQKMSKSARNFTLVKDLLKRHEPEALRLFLLSDHYAHTLDYTSDRIRAAEGDLALFRRAVKACEDCVGHAGGERGVLEASRQAFFQAIDDDLDTPHALTHLRQASLHVESLCKLGKMSGTTARQMLDFYRGAGRILGVLGGEKR